MATFTELIQSGKPLLVDFSAEWCGPCKMMAPILKELKDKLGEKLTIIKIDIDKSPMTARSFQVQSVPTLIFFKDHKITWRQSGVMPAAQIAHILEPYI